MIEDLRVWWNKWREKIEDLRVWWKNMKGKDLDKNNKHDEKKGEEKCDGGRGE